MSAGFLEIQLDPRVSYGTSGGLKNTTMVVTNPSRKETRFPQQSRSYWNLTINFSDRNRKQMALIQAHFNAVKGKAYGWRFRNFREYYTFTDPTATTPQIEPLPTYLGGTTLQLTHIRNPNIITQEIIPIKKPDMVVPPVLYRNGTIFPAAGNWSLDTSTGIVTFNTSQTGNTFAWSGYWDTPVRFDEDEASISWDDFDIFSWTGIKIMEIQVP